MNLIATMMMILCACSPRVIDIHHGKASYYSDSFQDHRTASGEVYDTSLYTAAHMEFAFGQEIRVIRKDNGKAVSVRVNDRGPYNKRRIIDISKAAARDLGMLDDGVVEVTLEILAK